MNLIDLEITLPKFYHARQTAIVLGPPGVGKTETIRRVAGNLSKQMGVPFGLCTSIISGMDPVDLRGVYIPMKADDGTPIVRATKPAVWPGKHNTHVYIDGEYRPDYDGPVPEFGIADIDEISQADADLQKVAANYALERRIGEHKLPDGWSVLAAGNRMEDRAGVTKMLSHVQNRVCSIEVEPDYEAWQKWAFENNIHPLSISFAKANAGEVFRLSVPKQPGPYATPRSLVLCSKMLEMSRTRDMHEMALPDDHIAASIVKGYLGEAVLPKFLSHIRLANDLPTLEEVLDDPKGTKVPDRLDARFVMATSMAVHAKDEDRLRPILTYMRRLDVELQTLFVQSVVSRNPHALAVAEFSEWVQQNQKLILATNQ